MSAVFEDRHSFARIEATSARAEHGDAMQAMESLYQMSIPHPFRGAELDAAIAAVDEFAAMKENWDGYGAARIAEAASNNAKSALSRLLGVTPCPDLSPNPNGTISMEWEGESGYAVLEVGNSRYSFYMKVGNNPPYSVAGNANEVSLSLGRQILGSLYPQTRSGSERIATVITFPSYVRSTY